MPNDNMLSELNICHKEDVISDIVKYCFERSNVFRVFFLEHFYSANLTDVLHTKIYTRKSFPTVGVPDIIILVEKIDKIDLVIIENKLKAEEGADQTERYAKAELAEDIIQRFGNGKTMGDIRRIFLTLFPDQKPASNLFEHKTYEVFTRAFSSESIVENSTAKLLFNSWLDLLNSFYSRGRVDGNDFIVRGLNQECPLDGSYLFFKGVFEKLVLPEGLYSGECFRGAAMGRKFYGAKFEKASWHTDEMIEPNEGKWFFNNGINYNIHIEPQFNVLNGTLSIPLHYELNWYESKANAHRNINSSDLQNYMSLRECFIDEMKQLGDAALDFRRGGWNQVCKVQLGVDEGWTVSDFREMVSNEFHRICNAVDHSLERATKDLT